MVAGCIEETAKSVENALNLEASKFWVLVLYESKYISSAALLAVVCIRSW